MFQIINSKQNFWKITTLILGIILVFSLVVIASQTEKIKSKKQASTESLLNSNTNETAGLTGEEETAEEISAKEIYPLFECPCCGESIDECTCPMAQERKNYIDIVIEIGEKMSKDEVILTYVKKYGLDSFMDEEKQKEFREKLAKEAPPERPIISINADFYDFGDISQKEGTVTTFFEIKNNGKTDLVINRLETSCGCTSASIIYNNEEGPKFNMPGHDTNEEIGDWEIIIAPGARAQLKVYYDPDMHSDFRGTATRNIYIYSNDPIDFQKKVSIELNQTN